MWDEMDGTVVHCRQVIPVLTVRVPGTGYGVLGVRGAGLGGSGKRDSDDAWASQRSAGTDLPDADHVPVSACGVGIT